MSRNGRNVEKRSMLISLGQTLYNQSQNSDEFQSFHCSSPSSDHNWTEDKKKSETQATDEMKLNYAVAGAATSLRHRSPTHISSASENDPNTDDVDHLISGTPSLSRQPSLVSVDTIHTMIYDKKKDKP